MKHLSFLLGLGSLWGLGACSGGALAGADTSDARTPDSAITDASPCPPVPPDTRDVDLTPSSSDIRRVKAVHCRETAGGGADLTVELAQTSFESGMFHATITATHPVSVDRTFCVWPSGVGGWSGHFFNLSDADGLFHLRIRAAVAGPDGLGDDNVQIFADAHMRATIVASDTIQCTIEVNP